MTSIRIHLKRDVKTGFQAKHKKKNARAQYEKGKKQKKGFFLHHPSIIIISKSCDYI